MAQIEDRGEIEYDSADGSNVPVDIWLTPARSEHDEDDEYLPEWAEWVLTAGNYMPRKGRVAETAYKVYSDDRDALKELIRAHWLPLYAKAMSKLMQMTPDEDGVASLYYWD